MLPSPCRRRRSPGTASSLHFLSTLLLAVASAAHVASASPLSTGLSVLAVAAAAAVVDAAPSSSSLPVHPLPALDTSAMSSNGIYLGFLTQWGVDEPSDVIRALGASPAAWGDYLNVGVNDYSFAQVDYHIGEIRAVANGDVRAIYAPAVLFNGRMNEWTPAMSTALAQKMRDVNRQGITVYLRFCYEMVRLLYLLTLSRRLPS
ncbi:hypothetical protein JCM9279_004818 [Rhodotorula babjevae]